MKQAVVILGLFGFVRWASGCDLCSIYSATEARGEIGKGPYAGVAEQFTRFNTLQLEGHEVPNEVDQFLNSSISQLFLGYNFSERFGVQFNVPIIYRQFRRVRFRWRSVC